MGHVIVILLWPLHHCTGTFPCTWLQRLTLLPYLPSAVASTDHRHTSPCPVFSFPTFINVFLWQLLLKHPLSKGSSVSAQHFSPNSGQLSFYSRGLNPNKSQTYLLLWSTHSQSNISTWGLVLWGFFRCYHSAFHLSLLDSVASCRLVDTHHWLQPTTSFSAFSSTVHNIRWLTVWPWTDHELIHCHHLCFLALSSISITLIYTSSPFQTKGSQSWFLMQPTTLNQIGTDYSAIFSLQPYLSSTYPSQHVHWSLNLPPLSTLGRHLYYLIQLSTVFHLVIQIRWDNHDYQCQTFYSFSNFAYKIVNIILLI